MTHFNILIAICLLITIRSNLITGYPDGAPPLTCKKNVNPNQPKHGHARPQSIETIPFRLSASSDIYHPGQEVSVGIYSTDLVRFFRVFFIQARDKNSNELIGEWVQSENSKTVPECLAITHTDNRDKVEAKLVWKAPQNRKGRVYFTGTILEEFALFWSDVVSKVQ